MEKLLSLQPLYLDYVECAYNLMLKRINERIAEQNFVEPDLFNGKEAQRSIFRLCKRNFENGTCADFMDYLDMYDEYFGNRAVVKACQLIAEKRKIA